MKYSLKSLFMLILYIAIPLAILLRPIREIIYYYSTTHRFTEEVNGFLWTFYPFLWLCYTEKAVSTPQDANLGVICGFSIHTYIFLYLFLLWIGINVEQKWPRRFAFLPTPAMFKD